MARTTTDKVEKVLGIPPTGNWDGHTDLTPFVESASPIITRAAALALSNKKITLTTEELELMERWLAAHFYLKQDPLYNSKSTSGKSGSFQRKQGEGFSSTEYGRAACEVDYSGSLTIIGQRQVAGGFHAVRDC